jgi:DNA-binding NarL/FixJ family response regulator
MSGIRVAIFDDNDSLRDSVAMLLKGTDDFVLCGSFASCLDLAASVTASRPDVVIMDIDLPAVNGIEGVKMIRQQFPGLQVLMFTVFENDELVFAAIRAGAGGYILKNAKPDLLLNAISEVFNGGAPMTPGIARKVLSQFQQQAAVKPGEDFHLSAREREVLGFLVDGLSYKMIGAQLHITYDTVRAHMKKIYEKLHVSSMTEAVAKAINQRLFPPR